MGDERVTVRLASSQAIKLDALAGAAGITRSDVLRRLLDGAADVGAPAEREPLDRDGTLALLDERARNGSTAAARLLLDEQRRDEADAHLARLRELTTEPAATA